VLSLERMSVGMVVTGIARMKPSYAERITEHSTLFLVHGVIFTRLDDVSILS